MALHGVAAVGLHVKDVVEAIDARCGETVGEEGDDACYQGIRMKQGTAKEQGYEYESVLDPLLGAYQSHQGGEALAIFSLILVLVHIVFLLHILCSCLILFVLLDIVILLDDFR